MNPFPAPLVVKPTGTAKYCLDFYIYQISNSAPLTWVLSFTFNAYVTGGTYTGIGTAGTAAAKPLK